MSQVLEETPAASNDKIVITIAEANSSHVDDLLRRQMSLRGESGVGTDPVKHWYYQNWLLFMIVGAIAALGAWLIIEPNFDDYHPLQGKIEAMDLDEVMKPNAASVAPNEEVNIFGAGWVTIRGQRVWLSPGLRLVKNERSGRPFDPEALKVGQEVLVLTKYYAGSRSDLAIARYIDPSPGKPSAKSLESLSDQSARTETTGILFFSIVAGMIGLAIGATDGIVCRLPRRALLGGFIGALVGFVGGLVSNAFANVVYIPLSSMAEHQMISPSASIQAVGFLLQMIARMFAWTLAGCAMGLGQGIALRSKRLFGYGFLGGVIGGLIGGLLFDPLDFVLAGSHHVGADWPRLAALVVIGAAVGAMIGIVELLARDAWLRMTEGPLAGKEFVLFRDVMNIGASPKSQIYLFNDDTVAPLHATLRTVGEDCEIAARDRVHPVLVNGRSITSARLRHGDRIQIGNTSFVFEQRQH